MLPLEYFLYLQIILFLFITPGTPRIVIISYSMNYGVEKCIWTALGDVTANIFQATLVIFFIGSFISDHPLFLSTFKWIGVIYISYLAYDIYKSKPKNINSNEILEKNFGVDGCSAPQYAFKIKELATALKNLCKSFYGKFEYSKNINLMISSILKNHLYIGGSNNLDSNLIRISNRNIFCKGGAEGVFLFLHLKKGIFGILKVVDGNERALSSAVYSLCKKFKILNKQELNNFILWNDFNLYNHAKIKVGKIKTIIR